MSLTTSPPLTRRKAQDARRWREESGFTLIELMVSMIMMIVVSLAAFSFLQFTTEDASHITERVHVDQVGRTALENVMLRLHSACVSQEVNPILDTSNENVLSFVSESGKETAFSNVSEHVITFTKTEGTLVEQTFPSTGPAVGGNYPFSATAASTTKLLTNVRQTEYKSETTPIFRYYRYYKKGDEGPNGEAEPPYGELDPNPLKPPLNAATAEEVVKVTMSFTVAPEGKEGAAFNHDRPVPLEDSAVFRLAPPSTASGHINGPCAETP